MKSLSHPNIVRFLGLKEVPATASNSGKIRIVMELCQGDLKKLLKRKKKLETEEVAYLVKHILEGLVYLHENNVIHR